jgi:hypothetical protein
MAAVNSPPVTARTAALRKADPLRWGLAGAVAVVLPVWWLYRTERLPLPYAVGIWFLYGLWILYSFTAGDANALRLAEGADSRPSTSKFQWLLWTLAVLYAYVVIAVRTDSNLPQNIPSSLVIAMGLSIGTMGTAKQITTSYITNGKITKTDATDPTVQGAQGLASLIEDDDAIPDLSKVQMLAWTTISIGTFLWQLVQNVQAPTPKIPNIDPSLMVFMGLGQVAYLGKKLITTTTPRLTGVTPPAAAQPQVAKGTVAVTLAGVGFGDQQAGSIITINALPIPAIPTHWEDAQITFPLPPASPDGSPWRVGDTLAIGVSVAGQDSVNTLPFAIVKPAQPRLLGVSPAAAALPDVDKGNVAVTVIGVGFGDHQNGSTITINGTPIQPTPTPWDDAQITFTVPGARPDGSDWQIGDKLSIGITVAGQEAANTLQFAIAKPTHG